MEQARNAPNIRQNALQLTSLVWVIVLGWIFLLSPFDFMESTGLNYFAAAALMWVVMMIAVMLPSAMPMILTFSSVYKKQKEKGNSFVPTWIFVLGYLVIWSLFAIIAAGGQWLLRINGFLSNDLAIAGPFAGIIIMAAGIYQLTPLKDMCLRKCQSPFDFLMTNWAEGTKGALIMGLNHGKYCIGCCWFLMILLFAAGIMNILWVAAIATFVIIEKLLPPGHWVSKAAGILLILIGIAIASGLIHS